MPAPHARAGCIWYAFFRTVSRRSAVIRSPTQICRCHQREHGRWERIGDSLIAHDRACAIRRAAPATGDHRVCCLPLNTGAGGLEEIHAFIAFTHYTDKNRVQQSGSVLFAVADQQALRDSPRMWYERNQAFDVYCISAERDSNAALRQRDHRV
jgi:hypothetical protein